MSGFIIAAPSSGSGKTTITLGLLRALKDRGIAISSGKAGPDFIDPQFHALASGQKCFNFDPWAMRPELISDQASRLTASGEMLIIEAMMGLFDGSANGKGSAADLAAMLGLSVILVVDCSKLSHSVAAIVSGFNNFRSDVEICGVILNRVASDRHEKMLRDALAEISVKVFGTVYRDETLQLPERHLGLVQANEHREIDSFIKNASEVVGNALNLDAIAALSSEKRTSSHTTDVSSLPPLAQKIAIAKDLAFSFSYSHILQGWREQGAELSFFSPLKDEAPQTDVDAIYLPGGYPELHADAISKAGNFKSALQALAEQGKLIYGECGGYMSLGEAIIDADGQSHAMLGLLPLVTSFADRKRNLGYRQLQPSQDFVWNFPLRGHEFHYSTVQEHGAVPPLFTSTDANGAKFGDVGMKVGNVCGSYMHVVDRAVP